MIFSIASVSGIKFGLAYQTVTPPAAILYPNLLPRLRQLSLRLINLLLPLAPSVKDQPHHSTTPMKSGRDHDQHSPLEEGYPKRVSVSECAALGSATPFLWLPAIFLPRFHRTPEEVAVVLFVKDLSFVQNLFDNLSILLNVVSRGDVLTVGNPSKDRDT